MDDGKTWEDAFREQEETRNMEREQARLAAQSQIIGENAAVFDNYMRMHAQTMAEQRQRNRRGAVNLLSAFKIGSYSGGNVPADMLPGLNDALGFDGKTRRIDGARIRRDGRMGLAITSMDPSTGQSRVDVQEFTPAQIYNMARENPGVMTRSELISMRDNIGRAGRMTKDMLDRDLPIPADDYDGPGTRVPVGEPTASGGTSVNPNWLYGPQRRANISAFGANGRGGFTNYDSNEDTGHQLQVRDSGTRAAEDKGRWKVLSSGAHGDGRRGTRYENDKTGEVVFVPEGQTIESVTRGVSDKERVAQIQENAKSERAAAQNETRLSVADLTAQLKRQGYDVDEKKLAEAVRHNQVVESQQAENEKGRNERAKRANELKTKMAEMKSRGTIGGRPPTTHEYVEALRFANDPTNDDSDRNAMREHAKRIEESLKQRGEKIPEPPPSSGKTEVKTGDNGGGDGRQFKEGDVQEINGIKMKLLPSKKNPGKLTWQRV